MKPQNNRRPKTISLSEQHRAIVVETICALIDSLLDLLIAVEPYPPFGIPSIASRPRRAKLIDDNSDLTWRVSPEDDNLDVARRLVDVLPPPKTPGTQYFWAYPLRPVWDKRIRTSRN